MDINFTKMHGIGNDYIYINCFKYDLSSVDISKLAIEMSPRRFSVGADGIILICPSTVADAKMRMFNADGSEGKMCGNGVRCVAKYCYDNNIAHKDEIAIETLSGIKKIKVKAKNGLMQSAVVDMGKAILMPAQIPVNSSSNNILLVAKDKEFNLTCVSMGNPHAVTFVDKLEMDVESYGKIMENASVFPERANIEFVKVESRNNVSMRVWERGSGETYACGTGACAVAVSSILQGYCDYDEPISVKLLGGTLKITVLKDLTVFMEGPASTIYNGVYKYEN